MSRFMRSTHQPVRRLSADQRAESHSFSAIKAMIPQVEVLNLVPKSFIMPVSWPNESLIAFRESALPCRIPEALSKAMPRPRKVPSKPTINSSPGILATMRSGRVATAWFNSPSAPCSMSSAPLCVPPCQLRSQAGARPNTSAVISETSMPPMITVQNTNSNGFPNDGDRNSRTVPLTLPPQPG